MYTHPYNLDKLITSSMFWTISVYRLWNHFGECSIRVAATPSKAADPPAWAVDAESGTTVCAQ